MIDINKKRVKMVLEEMHQGMVRKVKRGNVNHDDIILENRILDALCDEFDMGPTKCAIGLNEKYGYDLTGDQVIGLFRSRRIANPVERKELLVWAEQVAELFEQSIQENKEAFLKFETLRKSSALSNGKKHEIQERLAAVMIFHKFPEIDLFDDATNLQYLGNTLAKYYFYDISDAIANVYGFPLYSRNDSGKKNEKPEKSKITLEQAVGKIAQLERTLERTNNMLQELQNEFEQQIEESKTKELVEFFSQLNSEKYGCILDELLAVRKGMDSLKKGGYDLPLEINGLLIMVKRFIQFVRDSHIDPILKLNKVMTVKATDVEFCVYDGTPFMSQEEEKRVRVISPGWILRDKEVRISRPKVKEEI